MDLPTYTSIWRIEKRLYKLYDFRLPMPVPVGQIAVFAAITVPYVILLTILGLPFNHTLFWLYVLPPGVITWLATRPVLEKKRLPELIISQVRYLGEPGTWARMAPLAEKDDVVVIGKVWRRDEDAPGCLPRPRRWPGRRPAAAPAQVRRAGAEGRRAAGRRWTARPGHRGRPPARCRVPLRRRVRGAGTSEAVPLRGRRPRLARRGRRRRGDGHSPAEIAHDERQAPHRPAAEHLGRRAARPVFPAGAAGTAARNGEGIPRPGRAEEAPAARPAAASWPVKDPHTPASLVNGDNVGRASLDSAGFATPGPSGLRGSGIPGGPVGPMGPGAAHPVPAAGRPGPGDGRPGSGGGRPGPLRTRSPGRESGCAGRARHGHARRACSERAGAGGLHPSRRQAGQPGRPGSSSARSAPEAADSGDAEPLAAQDETAEHRTADPEGPT